MSVSLGRQILSRFHWKNNTRQVICAVSVRCSSNYSQKTAHTEDSAKVSIPAPEPGKIQSALLKNYGSLLCIENTEPTKTLGSHEVLIDVNYCALNGPDVLLSENLYTFQPNLPMVLGYEVTGKLIAIGNEAEKKGFKVGDKVIALNKERYGGFSEQCVSEIGDIWKISSSVKSLDAVCLLDNYIAALIALEQRARIEEDDMILINVGPGGIGLAAVDLATNVFRAKVIGVCASEDRASIVRERGAFASLKFNDKKLMKQIEEIAGERNITEIFKGVEGENFKKVLDCFTAAHKINPPSKDMLRDDNFGIVVQHLSREGRVIVAGVTAIEVDPKIESKSSCFSVSGISLQEYRKNNHELYRQAGDDIISFYEEGLISPTRALISGVYGINDAIQFVSKMKSSGKVIIDFKDKEAKSKIVN